MDYWRSRAVICNFNYQMRRRKLRHSIWWETNLKQKHKSSLRLAKADSMNWALTKRKVKIPVSCTLLAWFTKFLDLFYTTFEVSKREWLNSRPFRKLVAFSLQNPICQWCQGSWREPAYEMFFFFCLRNYRKIAIFCIEFLWNRAFSKSGEGYKLMLLIYGVAFYRTWNAENHSASTA